MRARNRSALVRGLFALVLGTGCASLFNLDDYRVGERDASTPGSDSGADTVNAGDVAADAAEEDGATDESPPLPECTTNAECTAKATAEGPIDAGLPDVAPDVDAGPPYNGTLDGGVVPAVCVRSIGKCARLLTADCRALTGDYTNENSIVVGTFFTVTGTLAAGNIPRNQAAVLAAEEINSSIAGGGIPSATDGGPNRPLLVVQCDPTASTIRTARHLVEDLHVPAVVGPNVAQDLIDVTQQVSAAGGTLLMSPTVPASPVTNLVDNGLTWRDVPSDDQRAKLLIDQINQIETDLEATRGNMLKLGIVYRTDALGLSGRDSISGKLIFNGHFLSDPANAAYVSLDHYDDLNNVPSQQAIAAKYATFQPDIVFVTAQEQVANVIIPLEQALTVDGGASPNRPYYVGTDVTKVKQWLTGISAPNVPSDFRSRIRGIGARPDGNSGSVFAAFNTAYTSRYGSNPGTSGMGPSYDGMYAVAYALAATRGMPPTGASVAKGLGSLGSGTEIPVGQSQASGAFQALAGGSSITLRGTYSLMQWDVKGDIVGGTIEVWCVGLPSGSPAFASSGRTLDVATQTLGGTYAQCN